MPSPLKPRVLVPAALLLACACFAHAASQAATQTQPILVELFTSEGCSSCPPADALLAQIAKERRDVIVLSEHVDYWNYLGWTDPFSSEASTRRQSEYAQRFNGEGPYTPQMVVDGTRQFVGNDRSALHAALTASADKAKPKLTLAELDESQPQALHVSIKLDATPAKAHLIAVLVQNEGHQEVRRGENGGRSLMHVSIAREFRDLGEVAAARAFDGQTSFKLPANAHKADFHVVVFLQQNAGGPVLSAATT